MNEGGDYGAGYISQRNGARDCSPPSFSGSTIGEPIRRRALRWNNVHLESQVVVPYATQSPFSTLILVEPISKKFSLPEIDYNGIGDPEDHIAMFASIMHLTIATNVVWCKCFPTTLFRLDNNSLTIWHPTQYSILVSWWNNSVATSSAI